MLLPSLPLLHRLRDGKSGTYKMKFVIGGVSSGYSDEFEVVNLNIPDTSELCGREDAVDDNDVDGGSGVVDDDGGDDDDDVVVVVDDDFGGV